MPRLLLLAALSLLLAACDSYYGGAPGYAANGRLTLSQLALAPSNRDNPFQAKPIAIEASAAAVQ